MNDITVTMTMDKYETMKRQIETTKKHSLYQFIKMDLTKGLVVNGKEKEAIAFDVTLDLEAVINKIVADHKRVANVTVKHKDDYQVYPIPLEGEENEQR